MKVICRILALNVLLWTFVSSAVAQEPVKIAAIFATSGIAAVDNHPGIQGSRLAATAINEKGGLLGRPVELVELDNGSTALGSKKAAKEAAAAGVCAVVGPFRSSHALAMAPVLQEARIPMVTPTATNPDVTRVGNYIFRAIYVDSFTAVKAAEFALKDLGAQTAAVITNTNEAYSIGLSRFFTDNFAKLGGRVLIESEYLNDTVEFKEMLSQVIEQKPDVVFLPGYSKDSGFIIKQARKMGLQCPFIGGDGWTNKMYNYGGEAISGNYYINYWHPDMDTDMSRDFVKGYEKTFNAAPAPGLVQTYDALLVLGDAIKRAGTADPGRIRDALAATDGYKGITGDYSFNANGDPIKPVVILQFEKSGSVFVKTIQP